MEQTNDTPYTVAARFLCSRVRKISTADQGLGIELHLESYTEPGAAMAVVMSTADARQTVAALRHVADLLEARIPAPGGQALN
jgi:hypothetical protein